MKEILLISYFDSQNLGDLLISNNIYKNFKEYGFSVSRVSYTGNPHYFMDINNIVYIESTLKRKSIIRELFKKSNLLRSLNRKRLSRKKLQKIKKDIDNSKMVVFGGGNLLFDLNNKTNSSHYFSEIIKYCKKKNKKTAVISVGIGPFYLDKQEKLATKYLSKVDLVSFRDQKSLDIYLSNYPDADNYSLSYDPILAIDLMKKENITKNIIGLNLLDPNFTNVKPEIAIDFSKKLIQKLLKETTSDIVLFSTDLVDYKFLRTLLEENNKRVKLFELKGLSSLLSLYESIDFLIGMRMHALITSHISGLPIIAIEWQSKVRGFMENINYDDLVFNINNNDINKIIRESNKIYQEYSILLNKHKIESYSSNDYEVIKKILENK